MQASLLHYARQITQANADGAAVLDCVLVVPPYFGPRQRQAMVDAAQLAGLSVLSLVNSHAAAALQVCAPYSSGWVCCVRVMAARLHRQQGDMQLSGWLVHATHAGSACRCA